MLAMWLETVFVLSESSRAISRLLSPLASRVKISSSLAVRTARIATAAVSVFLTGMSSSRRAGTLAVSLATGVVEPALEHASGEVGQQLVGLLTIMLRALVLTAR